MSEHNPELQPPPHPHPDEAIQPNAPDFVETPDVLTVDKLHEKLPVWLYLVCGFALFLAGSSFTGFSTFGSGLLDAGPGGPAIVPGGSDDKPIVMTPAMKGKKIYGNNCASCHQGTGEGQPGSYPPLAGSEWVIGNKERLTAIMLHGLAGPMTVKGGSYGSNVMPAWDSAFTDDQMADLMTYLRSEWGNTANEVTSDEVGKARAKFASHSGPFNEADLMKIAPNGPDPSDKK